MKVTRAMVVLSLLFCGAAPFATAQEDRGEVFVMYSYMRFNPTLPALHNRSYNGGGGGATFNFGPHFGIKAEFMGYGSTTWKVTATSAIVTSRGTIPAGTTLQTQANMFTYMFGPVVRAHFARAIPFGEVLFGGSNTNGYGDITKSVTNFHSVGTQHPFTMAVGGGIDVKLNEHVVLKAAELDYILTRYTNPFTSTNNQNHFRYAGGLGFTF